MKKDAVLIFDFFGVICSEIAPYWLVRYFSEEEAKKVKSDIVSDADLGRINEAEMFRRLAEATGENPDKILSDWLELAMIDKKVVDFLKTYNKAYRICLLSNAPGEFLHRILARENLYGYFEKIVISSEAGIAKPDKRIFELMLKEMNCEGNSSVMIDDNKLNLDGAEKVGCRTILFTCYDKFVTDLKNALKDG